MTQIIDIGLGGPGEGAWFCRSSRSRWPTLLYHPLYAAPIPLRTKFRITKADFIKAEVRRRRGERFYEDRFVQDRHDVLDRKLTKFREVLEYAAPKGRLVLLGGWGASRLSRPGSLNRGRRPQPRPARPRAERPRDFCWKYRPEYE